MERSEWANNWWQQALHDLEAARVLRHEGFWDTCTLMCQQAAEKAIKAVWIDVKDIEAPKTHWVERLAEELGAPDDVALACYNLTADYAASRYPGPSTKLPFTSYSSADADDRIMKADTVLLWASAQWEPTNADQ